MNDNYDILIGHILFLGEWSCWTDFSQCSKTCGVGFHYRQRHCRAAISGKLYTKECVGNAYEKQSCNLSQCPGKSLKPYNNNMYIIDVNIAGLIKKKICQNCHLFCYCDHPTESSFFLIWH